MTDMVTTEGFDNIIKNIEEMGISINKYENKALKKAGEVVADEMRDNVVVSKIKHKHIKDDIKVSGVRTSKDGEKYVNIAPGKDTNWRALFLEFGTTNMDAQPFMEVSLQNKEREVQETIVSELKKAMK